MNRPIYKVMVLIVVLSMIMAAPAFALLPTETPRVENTEAAPAAPAPAQQPAAAPRSSGHVPVESSVPAAVGIDAKDDQITKDKDGFVKIVIELQDEPTAVTYANAKEAHASELKATQAAQAQLAKIEAAQQALLAPLAKLGAAVIYRTQRVYNGIAVRVKADQLDSIQQLAGVKAIHALVSKQLDLTTSVPTIGAPKVWDAAGVNATGEGIKVGIIDTGIDYIHADFGGVAAQAAYAANDTTVITDTFNGNLLYPTVKVAGGWDFAGDNYDASGSPAQQIPHPDPDPSSCLNGTDTTGHGTHVAGIAAGYGVTANGLTYTGTYGSGLDFNSFRVGPGVAPKATLYSLRVFGCNGSTDLTDQAIEWATDPNGDGDFSDHLDVINMSLGSAYGTAYDPSAVASNNAVLAGVAVVASAGNNNDVYYITGSPSVATRALSTASSVDRGATMDGFRVNPPSTVAGVYPASPAVAFNWATLVPFTTTLVYPDPGPNPAQDQRTGCYTFNITNTNLISGNIVLLDWTVPSCGGSVARTGNAYAAGAKGVILVDNDDLFDLSIAGSSVIPSYSAPKSVGDQLKPHLPVSATFTNQYQGSVRLDEPKMEDVASTFTSRGPRRVDSMLKPDIAAPGDTIWSAANLTGNGGKSLNGTSMSSPHMAGAMALMRQLHPTWTVEELKAVLMDTASHPLRLNTPADSPQIGPGRIGAGRADLAQASQTDVVAFNAGTPGAVSVSFGAPEVLGSATLTRRVRVVNKGPDALIYSVSYKSAADMPGVTYSFSPAIVTLAPFGAAMVDVTMTADATQMKRAPDPSVSLGGPRQWVSEESGYLLLTSGYPHKLYLPLVNGGSGTGTPVTPPPAVQLRVPIYAAPRAVSAMHAVQSSMSFTGITGTAAISLTGVPVATGVNYPYDVISLVSAFELQEVSPDDASSAGFINHADLKYIGAGNDFMATGYVTATTIFFALATQGNWTVPSSHEVEFDVLIDTNRDGTDDYVLYNRQTGGSTPNDVFASRLVNLSTGAGSYQAYLNAIPANLLDTAVWNNNVMVLGVSAASLGLSAANPRFNYHVVTYSRDTPTSAAVDTSAVHTYAANTPGLDFTANVAGIPGYFDLPGAAIPVRFDLTAYQANNSIGALLLHHHNGDGAREDVVNVNLPPLVPFTIAHTNDFHGQLEASGSNPGYARDAAVIKQIRNQVSPWNFLYLDAGDEMQGSLLSNLNKGAPVIDLFNFDGVNAATFGNHEFDWGQQVLISRTQQANYPFVTANIVVSDTDNCATAGWTTPSFARPWITTTVGTPGNQAVVGIVGVTTLETPQITIASATQGLCFKDPAQSVNHYIPAMQAAGAQVIIVLSHLGYNDGGYGYGIPVYGDQTLAKKLVEAGTPANMIIGGHSHTNLAAATVISGTTIVQAYYNGRNVGRADLLVNKTTGAVTINWQRISVSTSSAEDAATKARITTWSSDPVYQALINQPIGYTKVDLLRGPKSEGMMGDFVDDAVYNYLNNDSNPANDVDLFFNNAGGIRTDWCRIPDPAHSGQYIWSSTASDCHTGVYTDTPMLLTYGNMFTILPFGNATVVGRMTGAQIMDVVNYGPLVSNGVIQPAGIKYSYYAYTDTNPGPQPYAWGAYSITVKNRNTGIYEPLVMTKTYSVGTNEFLAPAGGDGYNGFKYMTNITYWGDMLNAVNAWVTANYTITTPYQGPNNDGTLDGRLIRNGTDTYGGTATEVVPVTILHHNDSHGDLLDYPYRGVMQPGYTRLATLIKQERGHNPTRTLLLDGGDNIQGDAMMAFYKAAFTGKGADGTALPITLTVNPLIAAMNSMDYDAMTLGNHEFNFGHYIFTGTLGQADFPLLQANLYDDGSYGIAEVGVQPYITKSLPGPAGNINLAVLGIGNHRVPQYELPSNIPGLTFTNPITEAQSRAPALKAANDVVIALTHIGFTTVPGSIEVDTNVDTNLAAQTTGIDAIVGAHSHTNPLTAQAPYKFLPTYVGAPDNTPVIINQAQSYNYFLGEMVLGLLPKVGGGYQVVARAGRDLQNCIGLNSPSILCSAATPEDAATKAIVKPYDDFLVTYKTRVVGQTTVPIDALNAYITETNAANLQADASVWKLNTVLAPTVHVDFHLSGAMTNQKIAATATPTNPYTMTVNDMFTLMPYENSLVVFRLNGPQLQTILERAYRNYWYYKNGGSGHGGYSYYTTCMLDINAGGIITYTNYDPNVYTTTVPHVGGLSFGNTSVDFLDATTYYTVSTVNYLAAGSCNFNDGGVTIWPLSQIVADTQNYVRDVVIEYIPTLSQPITPAVENRIRGIP